VCESAGRDEVRYALAGLEEKIKERLQELARDSEGTAG